MKKIEEIELNVANSKSLFLNSNKSKSSHLSNLRGTGISAAEILEDALYQASEEKAKKLERKALKKNKIGVSLLNQVAGWPSIRSFTFDIHGNGKI